MLTTYSALFRQARIALALATGHALPAGFQTFSAALHASAVPIRPSALGPQVTWVMDLVLATAHPSR